jgi:hypothetical protein
VTDTLENGRIRYYGPVQPANSARELAGRRCRSLDNFGMGTLARTYALESLQTIRRVMLLPNIHF